MSISIYYAATRPTPLTTCESSGIIDVIAEHSVDDQIEAGTGPNWESFCVFDPANPTAPNVVFEGATKLPDNSEDAM